MRNISILFAGLLCAGTPGFASGVVVPPAPPVIIAEDFSWAGAYAGLGLSAWSLEAEDFDFGPGPFDMDGGTISLFAGYNHTFGDIVVGAEISYTSGGVSGDDGAFMDPVEIDSTVQAELRAGYAFDRVLPYLTLGVVSSDVFSNHGGFGASNQTYTGVSYGIGVDYAIGDSFFVRVEYEQVNYNQGDFDFGGGDLHDFDMDGHRLSVGAAYRF